MLLVIGVFYIFQKLAGEFHKNRILWGIIGAVSYFVFQFLFGILHEVYTILTEQIVEEDLGLFSSISWIGWLFSMFCLGVLYYILNHFWKKEAETNNYKNKSEIDEIGSEKNNF